MAANYVILGRDIHELIFDKGYSIDEALKEALLYGQKQETEPEVKFEGIVCRVMRQGEVTIDIEYKEVMETKYLNK